MMMKMNQKKTIAQCYYIFFVNGALALMIGSLLPYLRETYGIDYRIAGFLVSAHSIGNLCSSFLGGALPIWLGRKKTALLLCTSGVVAFLLMTVTGNPLLLILAFFLTGINRGAVSNFNNAIINDVSGGKAAALNLLHAFFCTGALLSPFVVLLFVRNSSANWIFAAFLMAGAIATELAVIWRMTVPNNYPAKAENARNDWSFLRNKRFVIACGILFSYMCAEQAINGWLVTYLKDTGIMSEEFSQIMASLLWGVILIGRLTSAALSTRIEKPKLLLANSIGYVAFFVLLITARSSAPCIAGIIGIGFFMAGLYPTTIASIGDIAGRYPLALSFVLTFAGAGAILMPSVVGVAAQHIGIYGGMSVIVVAVAVSFLFILWNYLNSRRVSKHPNL
ncbi:MAG: MFS transporter [Eubacteriales bacterium]|nr:MFS transporter [Eubacteriales bacterium]